ncbi:MAG: hypothetical protein ABL912_12860 [Novosphingobium sp.]
MSKQLSLSIVVSLSAMISFVLLSHGAGAQLASDARGFLPMKAELAPMPNVIRLLPILQ